MFGFSKKIPQISLHDTNLILTVALARKIGLTPREFIDLINEEKNFEFLATANEYMIQEAQKNLDKAKIRRGFEKDTKTN